MYVSKPASPLRALSIGSRLIFTFIKEFGKFVFRFDALHCTTVKMKQHVRPESETAVFMVWTCFSAVFRAGSYLRAGSVWRGNRFIAALWIFLLTAFGR